MFIKNNKQQNRLRAFVTAPFSVSPLAPLASPRLLPLLVQTKHDIYRLICQVFRCHTHAFLILSLFKNYCNFGSSWKTNHVSRQLMQRMTFPCLHTCVGELCMERVDQVLILSQQEICVSQVPINLPGKETKSITLLWKEMLFLFSMFCFLLRGPHEFILYFLGLPRVFLLLVFYKITIHFINTNLRSTLIIKQNFSIKYKMQEL